MQGEQAELGVKDTFWLYITAYLAPHHCLSVSVHKEIS